jgi:hypothetical protein
MTNIFIKKIKTKNKSIGISESLFHSPTRSIILGFTLLISIGTSLLMLPTASAAKHL